MARTASKKTLGLAKDAQAPLKTNGSKGEFTTTTSGLPANAIENAEEFLRNAAERALLKFDKGVYVTLDDEEVAVGTAALVNPNGILAGHVCFKDGEYVGEDHRPVFEGSYTPRAELGDHDEEMWDVSDDGKPMDPWRKSRRVQVRLIESGEQYDFVTTSWGGRKAVDNLVKAILKALKAGQQGTPVVTLEVGHFDTKQYKRVPKPDFPIVDWMVPPGHGVDKELDDDLRDLPFA